jgi:hypothetical protein
MKAAQRIGLKEDSIRYKKVGKRYVQVNDPYGYDGLGDGWWLIKVAPGSKTIRTIVYPNNAEIKAAALDKVDQMIDIIKDAGKGVPGKGELTPEALADWNVFIAKHGGEFNYVSYPSLHDVATKIIDSLVTT